MPNIEIHGLEDGEATNKARAIAIIITRDVPELAEVAVITIFQDKCVSLKGEPQPFLRIKSSNPNHFEPLKTALSSLHLDIEVSDLKEFIPAKK